MFVRHSTNSGMGFVNAATIFFSNGIKQTKPNRKSLPLPPPPCRASSPSSCASYLPPRSTSSLLHSLLLTPPPLLLTLLPPVHWPLSKCVFASPSEAQCVSATWPQANPWPVVHGRKDKAGDLYRLSSPLTVLVAFPTSRRHTFDGGDGRFLHRNTENAHQHLVLGGNTRACIDLWWMDKLKGPLLHLFFFFFFTDL